MMSELFPHQGCRDMFLVSFAARSPGLLFSSLDLQKNNNASCPYTDTADFTASSLACILSNVVEDMHYVHCGANAQCAHVRGFVDSVCTLFVHIEKQKTVFPWN